MKKSFSILISLLLGLLAVCDGQPAPPNEAGVSMGHIHLNVPDRDAERKVFLMLGGTLGGTERPNPAVKIPGVLILFETQKNAATGGSEGSVIDHFGFHVPNVQAVVQKWQAAGLKVKTGSRTDQAFLYTPNNVKLELLEDPAITVPIAMHHIHFFVPESEVPKMKEWYARVWGGKPGKRGNIENVSLPGVELDFSKSEGATLPTKGRALDHIGFELEHLEAYCEKQEAMGVKFLDKFYIAPTGMPTRWLTDPWGVSMELKEGQGRYYQ